MYNPKKYEEKDLPELIKEFEGDIVYDVHSYTARFERSLAQRELKRRGKDALPAIIDHLKANSPDGSMDLDTAWGHLLCLIQKAVAPTEIEPKLMKDTPGWIAWAERVAS